MNIYLFFKKFYILFWKNTAIYLGNRWMTPNIASILSLVFIVPLFLWIYFFIDNLVYFTIAIFFAINFKLILNAIDWIIARNKNINTKMWMYLNVWTDIWPDIFIIFLILSKFGISINFIYILCFLVFIYLLLEFLFIHIYNKQNLFYWKDFRTFFYILLFVLLFLEINFFLVLIIYLFILILHNVWFFIKKYTS